MRVVKRFEELGVPKKLIEFYKAQEPFNFFEYQSSTHISEHRGYVSYLGREENRFEGEVDQDGYQWGKGIHMLENEKFFAISEGFRKGNYGYGLVRTFKFLKDTQHLTLRSQQVEDGQFYTIAIWNDSLNQKYEGY